MPSEEEDAKMATRDDFEEKEVNTWVKTNTKCEEVRNYNPYLLYSV